MGDLETNLKKMDSESWADNNRLSASCMMKKNLNVLLTN